MSTWKRWRSWPVLDRWLAKKKLLFLHQQNFTFVYIFGYEMKVQVVAWTWAKFSIKEDVLYLKIFAYHLKAQQLGIIF